MGNERFSVEDGWELPVLATYKDAALAVWSRSVECRVASMSVRNEEVVESRRPGSRTSPL